MKKNIIIPLLFAVIICNSQTIVKPSLIKWYTIEQADSLSEITPKPLFIDVYTDWCGWCKHMMKTTFANEGIAGYINNNFYPVRFDAETHDTIDYQGKTYTNTGKGSKPKHDFAKFILNGKYSFPTIVYIDNKKTRFPVPGYQKPKAIEPILVYFAEQIHLNASYRDFERYFYTTFPDSYKEKIKQIPDSLIPDTTGVIKWYSVEEASKLSQENKKIILFNFYTDWCQSCKILEKAVYTNPVISELINKNFYPVKFNAASQDSVKLYDQVLKGNGENKPHQLTYALVQQSFQFPAHVYLGEGKQKLNEMHGFVTPKQLEIILTYFSEKAYTKVPFQEYVKKFKGKIRH